MLCALKMNVQKGIAPTNDYYLPEGYDILKTVRIEATMKGKMDERNGGKEGKRKERIKSLIAAVSSMNKP